MKQFLGAVPLILCLAAACSSEPASAPADSNQGALPATTGTAPSPASPPQQPAAAQPPSAPPVGSNVLTPAGLGALRIGQAVPAGSKWAERGAQIPGGCTTISSPDFPGAHAIVEEGRVRRVTVGGGSDAKLAEGIGAGATEAQVRAAFPGFVEEPHKYVAAPAKYLTAPGAERGGPALRFEIGADRKVSLIHAGTMPVLGYVEGCA
jgi:hypothetical protein